MMIGLLLISSAAGLCAAVTALTMGFGVWPAFIAYTSAGFITLVCVTLLQAMRNKDEPMDLDQMGWAPPPAAQDTLSQWLDDDEIKDDDQSGNPSRVA